MSTALLRASLGFAAGDANAWKDATQKLVHGVWEGDDMLFFVRETEAEVCG